MLLSIIIPVYNTEYNCLKRCFKPFIKNYDSRIEIIVVDDGSSREVHNKLLAFVKECSVSCQFLKQKNAGQNSARNLGIENAKGKYVGFLDSDDSIIWDKLIAILDYIQNKDFDFIGFNIYEIDSSNKKNIRGMGNLSQINIKREALINCQEMWTQFIKKDSLKNRLIENVYIGEDLISIFPVICNLKTFVSIPLVPYVYYFRETSISNQASFEKRLSILNGFNILLKDNEIKNKYKEELEWQAIYHIMYVEAGNCLKAGFRGIHYAKTMQKWVNELFPNWENNLYLLEKKKKLGLSFRILCSRHIFIFYFLWKIKILIKKFAH